MLVVDLRDWRRISMVWRLHLSTLDRIFRPGGVVGGNETLPFRNWWLSGKWLQYTVQSFPLPVQGKWVFIHFIPFNYMEDQQRIFDNICLQMKSLRSGILDPIARAIQRLDWWWPEWESLSWVLACARWKWNSGKDDRTPLDLKGHQDDQFAFCQGFWSWRWSCKSTWWPAWKRW